MNHRLLVTGVAALMTQAGIAYAGDSDLGRNLATTCAACSTWPMAG